MNDSGEFERSSTETITPVVESADPSPEIRWQRQQKRWQRRSFAIAALLFALTLISTLVVGASFAASYALGQSPNIDGFFAMYGTLLNHPRFLLAGMPFAFTLLGILLAHELGHFFACRYYGISASYPYFIPAPTLIGTLGAFIRIRSPIRNRDALFDVGLAGPVVGFLFAIPALAIAIAYSRVIPLSLEHPSVVFGNPLALRILLALLRPGVPPSDLLLDPVGRAAWVGLFATSLNLLPGGQLDGGHIVFSIAPRAHKIVSRLTILILLPMAYFLWTGWFIWAILLWLSSFRHPQVAEWPRVSGGRLWLAAFALLMLVITIMPAPMLHSSLPEVWHQLRGR